MTLARKSGLGYCDLWGQGWSLWVSVGVSLRAPRDLGQASNSPNPHAPPSKLLLQGQGLITGGAPPNPPPLGASQPP